ncbi:hypothetical protein IE53DRAFT_384635 [Violaceomyces palustris]|uniref:Uncharacterized protein n=1 Tax=Violaceomyces palustris TaxID=1673888 RepID=A0ACD0P4K6_9BASI|nr:hypothetical protein IE53DRAFT_384635 [Violaceomyces palustris]
MGHGTNDKLFITPAEHSGVYGQHGATTGASSKKAETGYQRLPFDCCAISLQPWTNPVCSKEDGTIFELTNVIPFVKKYGVNPATGKEIDLADLVKLNFSKNERGSYHDPVSFKEFGEHTHMVAVAPSGNVFSYETVSQLNIKAKFMRDLLTDEPFTKKDIITLQDPHNAEQKDISQLHHVKQKLVVTEADRGIKDSEEVNISATGSAGSLLKKLREQREEEQSNASTSALSKDRKAPTPSAVNPKSSNLPYNLGVASTGMTAASFTSSGLTPRTKSEKVLIDEEEYMFEQVSKGKGKEKEKGYVRISTNFGPLNLELHCDKAPKTCYNFLQLCRQGKYDDTIFHRNIPGFMIQGGDPTGTGRGGESFWGKPFRDELDNPGAYRHTGRGILSMANKGPGTNGSQFFLTYRATPHLDKKHTVFGRLVNDEKEKDVLKAMEEVPTESGTDRPLRSIRILEVGIFEDPFERYKEKLEKKLKRENPTDEDRIRKEEKRRKREEDRTTWLGTELPRKEGKSGKNGDEALSGLASGGGGVGKYLGGVKKSTAAIVQRGPAIGGGEQAKKKRGGGGFGDFSGW